jgi:predicted lipid-binding transport protein (Tim44 family)
MNNFRHKVSVVVLAFSLIASPDLFAARVGKSRSVGMRRTVTTQNTQKATYGSNNQYRQTTPNTAPNYPQNQERRGPGVGTALAGAAAGAVGGYMLGKAMATKEPTAASAPISQEQPELAADAPRPSQFPWGIIAVLALLLVIGLMMFRRKASPEALSAQNLNNYMANDAAQKFEIPRIQDNPGAANPSMNSGAQVAPAPAAIERLTDGVETQFFLRQAKGMFLHIQSMNNSENVAEVAKYMTADLYTEIKQDILNNDSIADFSELNCQLLDTTIENNNHIASVEFSGKVSESATAPVTEFKEIWHFMKPVSTENGKWLVAGIQQA